MKVECCICGAKRERQDAVVVVLSDEEKAAIRQMKVEPPNEYAYCKPCHRLTTDREQGARLIQGLVQTRLQLQGNPKAEEIGRRYYEFFIQKAKVRS